MRIGVLIRRLDTGQRYADDGVVLREKDMHLTSRSQTITLTWETDVNAIIAYASRAFALYYLLQCMVAFVVAWQKRELTRRVPRLAAYAFLAVMCGLVYVLGIQTG